MWRLLSKIATLKTTAIVLTTHNMLECEAVCTRVCIMKVSKELTVRKPIPDEFSDLFLHRSVSLFSSFFSPRFSLSSFSSLLLLFLSSPLLASALPSALTSVLTLPVGRNGLLGRQPALTVRARNGIFSRVDFAGHSNGRCCQECS